MKKYGRSALLALSMAVAGCGNGDKGTSGMNDLLSHRYTTCIGRFLATLPEGMTNVSPNNSVTLYYGLGEDFKTVEVTVESLEATSASLTADVTAKAAKIGQDDNWKTKQSMLLEHKAVNDHAAYLRYWDGMESAVAQKHDLHILVGKTQLLLQATSYEGLKDVKETGEQVDARLTKLASQIRPYDAAEKAGPGFCLGAVVIDGDNDEEQANITLRWSRFPDLGLSLYSKGLTADAEEKPLLERSAQFLSRPDVHVLRKDTTSLGGMKADEVLARGKDTEHDNVQLLMFAVQSRRIDPALERPMMSIRLDAGGQLADGPQAGEYVNASLTEDQATALWDSIVKSVQPRPHAVRSR